MRIFRWLVLYILFTFVMIGSVISCRPIPPLPDNSVPGIPGNDSLAPQTEASTSTPTAMSNQFPPGTPDRNLPMPTLTPTLVPTATPVPDDCRLVYRLDKLKMALHPSSQEWYESVYGEFPKTVVFVDVWFNAFTETVIVNYIATDSSGKERKIWEIWSGCLYVGFGYQG